MNKWRDLLVSEDASIMETLNVIDRGANRIAFVVDSTDKLLGAVSDGDIRRALIAGESVHNDVLNIMKRKPKVLRQGFSESDIKNLMSDQHFLALPIVDDEGKVCGIYTAKDQHVPPVHDNPVFIMAGGFGTRLRPLTDECPKPMLKVGEKPMLEHLINQFKQHGFHNFYISTHYLPEIIEKHFGNGDRFDVSITYVFEESPLGTGGALSLLPDSIPELPLILINGDILTRLNFSKLLEFHRSSDAYATMCVREYEYQIPYGVVETEGYKVNAMVEKPVQRFFINAGVYVIEPEVYKTMTSNTKVDMPSLLETKMSEGKNIHRFIIHDYWLDIGQIQDFERAQTDIKLLDY